MEHLSWGRFPRIAQQAFPLGEPSAGLPQLSPPLLPRGLGRSYGDSCLSRGTLLPTSPWNRFLAFDEGSGLLKAEAGTSLDRILEVLGPRGFLPPVLPGTRHVSLGGALASDVHGKNHHRAGTFGCHVKALELLRSDGSRTICSREQNGELFAATIGGLGLTGLVTWVELKLKAIPGPMIRVETQKLDNIDHFFRMEETDLAMREYTVAWIDSGARGSRLGRGHYIAGEHADLPRPWPRPPLAFKVPGEMPTWLLNPLVLQTFNRIYHHSLLRQRATGLVSLYPFFFPLDRLERWNLLYGRSGFQQYQCVTAKPETLIRILQTVADSSHRSFLTVLKKFGDPASPGLLSFPKPGYTLAMDFAQRPGLNSLFRQWDEWIEEDEGRTYAAKDARMSAESFQKQYPEFQAFSRWVDPAFSSLFWERVSGWKP